MSNRGGFKYGGFSSVSKPASSSAGARYAYPEAFAPPKFGATNLISGGRKEPFTMTTTMEYGMNARKRQLDEDE